MAKKKVQKNAQPVTLDNLAEGFANKEPGWKELQARQKEEVLGKVRVSLLSALKSQKGKTRKLGKAANKKIQKEAERLVQEALASTAEAPKTAFEEEATSAIDDMFGEDEETKEVAQAPSGQEEALTAKVKKRREQEAERANDEQEVEPPEATETLVSAPEAELDEGATRLYEHIIDEYGNLQTARVEGVFGEELSHFEEAYPTWKIKNSRTVAQNMADFLQSLTEQQTESEPSEAQVEDEVAKWEERGTGAILEDAPQDSFINAEGAGLGSLLDASEEPPKDEDSLGWLDDAIDARDEDSRLVWRDEPEFETQAPMGTVSGPIMPASDTENTTGTVVLESPEEEELRGETLSTDKMPPMPPQTPEKPSGDRDSDWLDEQEPVVYGVTNEPVDEAEEVSAPIGSSLLVEGSAVASENLQSAVEDIKAAEEPPKEEAPASASASDEETAEEPTADEAAEVPQVEEYTAEMNDAAERIAALQQQLEEVESQKVRDINKLKQDNAEQSTEMRKTLRAEMEGLNRRIAELTNQLERQQEEHSSEVQALNESLESTAAERRDALDDLAIKKQVKSVLESINETLTSQLATATSQLEEQDKEIEEQKNRMQWEFDAEVARMTEEHNARSTELQRQSARDIAQTRAETEQQLAAARAEVEEANRQKSTAGEELDLLTSQLDGKTQRIAEQSARIASLSAQLEQANITIATVEARAEESTAQSQHDYSQLQEQKEELETAIATVEQEKTEAVANSANLAEQVRQLQDQQAEQAVNLRETDTAASHLEEMWQEKVDEKKELREELDSQARIIRNKQTIEKRQADLVSRLTEGRDSNAAVLATSRAQIPQLLEAAKTAIQAKRAAETAQRAAERRANLAENTKDALQQELEQLREVAGKREGLNDAAIKLLAKERAKTKSNERYLESAAHIIEQKDEEMTALRKLLEERTALLDKLLEAARNRRK